MKNEHTKFEDEYFNEHYKGELLGKGGQGIVFRTKDPDLAIKLVTDENGNPITDTDSIKKHKERFNRVRLLPLPEGVNISIPLALLKGDKAGYVMQLLSDMVPFSQFWLDTESSKKITKSDIPSWLVAEQEIQNVFSDDLRIRGIKEIVHYKNTGGLRRRLEALYKCATLLARLNGNGLVYGDISPNNIFISEDINSFSIWLIDADNIRFEIKKGGSIIFTPRYGAPELVQGKDGARPSSDCHAFAVVAFYMLSLIHPFIGKKATGEDRGDWADDENDDGDNEEKALKGLFPWVDDEDNDSNSTNAGLPRPLLLTPELQRLFNMTFGSGRVEAWLRPAIYHWPKALAQAADTTIQCHNCEMTYYFNYKDSEVDKYQCPYCNTLRPEYIKIESYQWLGKGGDLGDLCWNFIREIKNGEPLKIPRRLFSEFTMTESDTEELSIKIDNSSVLIKKTGDRNIKLFFANKGSDYGKFSKIISKIRIERDFTNTPIWIFSESNTPRLLLFSIIEGER